MQGGEGVHIGTTGSVTKLLCSLGSLSVEMLPLDATTKEEASDQGGQSKQGRQNTSSEQD